MKILQIMALALFMTGCTNAQSTTVAEKLDVIGKPLPAIRHITDMKVYGDTLLFVFECEDGYGQRLLRRAIIDNINNTLKISPDMGKREDGYYASYMPYPFISDNGSICVIGQDDCEIFAVENDTVFVSTRQYLMNGNSTVPFLLSQYVQDVYTIGPDKYVFIGREPNGGRQYAMTADLTTSKIDTVRQINISPELQSWMPNMGEMAYSGKRNRLAFAYKLHPIIEVFGLDGSIIETVRVGGDTFDGSTLEMADFDSHNQLQFIDLCATPEFLYALHGAPSSSQTIYQIDWNGNIISRFVSDNNLKKIAIHNDTTIIGYSDSGFVTLRLSKP